MRATFPLAVTALAAALALTACSSDDPNTGTGSDAATGGKNGTSTAAADAGACALTGLNIEVGPANAAPAVGDTGNLPVTLTNTKAGACTLDGFPKVTLLSGSTSWTVTEEKSAQPSELTLHQDESATFTLTYVRGEEGGKGAADTLRFSLPGDSGDKTAKWTYGVIAEKGSGLDATVTPFQTAGD
ncbi:DUF4232 domain-containing protein [Streptomyces sp. NBC_00670]|jgi:hypothetical protein|uniref:DUF4232 domain-containing protein n=1 Tax=Streptomyces sp. NBC_00670 TaxID=2975804 RepID=UPI002E3203EC|nr:DUF4232 domain-containing protein [Streptomyces sp. NBC_00670]